MVLAVRDAPREIRAAVLAMKAIDKDVRKIVNQDTRSTLNPVWKSLVADRARRARDSVVLGGGVRIAAGNPPRAMAAQSRRALSGGLIPSESWQMAEFGGDRNKLTRYHRTSPKGRRHTVTRHASRQIAPRNRKGHVVYPAFKEIAPRAVSLWVQSIVRTVYEAVEKGGKS